MSKQVISTITFHPVASYGKETGLKFCMLIYELDTLAQSHG